jgi:hypothetical protein
MPELLAPSARFQADLERLTAQGWKIDYHEGYRKFYDAVDFIDLAEIEVGRVYMNGPLDDEVELVRMELGDYGIMLCKKKAFSLDWQPLVDSGTRELGELQEWENKKPPEAACVAFRKVLRDIAEFHRRVGKATPDKPDGLLESQVDGYTGYFSWTWDMVDQLYVYVHLPKAGWELEYEDRWFHTLTDLQATFWEMIDKYMGFDAESRGEDDDEDDLVDRRWAAKARPQDPIIRPATRKGVREHVYFE